MSKAAGTLITTNNAVYIPPRFMPGYNGFVPTIKFDYGNTYGTGTAKYLQDKRFITLGNSRVNPHAGGYFSSFYSHNPYLGIESRTRTWDRWAQKPRYRLFHQDHDRREELINFSQQAMAHRENYSDKSGSVPKVARFQLPQAVEMQFKNNIPFIHRSFRYTDDINISNWDKQLHLDRPVSEVVHKVLSLREREVYDVYFPNRQKTSTTGPPI